MGVFVEFKDIDSILDRFQMHKTPYFSIWQTKILKFSNTDEEETETDLENATQTLRDCLEATKNSNIIYTLKFHKKADKKITDKSEYIGSLTFRLSDFEMVPNQGNGGNGGFVVLNGQSSRQLAPAAAASTDAKLDRLIELMTMQMQLLQAKENEEEEEEEEEEPEETLDEKIVRYTQIGSVIADKVTPILSMFLDKIFPNKTPDNNMGSNYAMAGAAANTGTNEERLGAAISKLVACIGEDKFVDTMEKLGKLAESDPGKLKGLLNWL